MLSLDSKIEPENAAIFFADLAGSSKTKSQHGSKKGTGKALLHNKIIYEAAKEYIESVKQEENFKVCKFIGDGVLLYFKSKNNKACFAALTIAEKIRNKFEEINEDPITHYIANSIITVQESMELLSKKNTDWMKIYTKMGLDFGAVYFHPFPDVSQILDPMGLIVDRAARVQSIAKEQQILVTRDFWTQLTNEPVQPTFCITGNWTLVQLRGIDLGNGSTFIDEVVNNTIVKQGVADPSISPEYLFGTDRMLKKFIEMKENLVQSDYKKLEINAIWIANWGDLKSYSHKEGDLYTKARKAGKDLRIKRLINKSTVDKKNMNDHLEELKSLYENDGNFGYVCKNLNVDAFEVMICVGDNVPISALLTIHQKQYEPSIDVNGETITGHDEPSIGIYLEGTHGESHIRTMLSLRKWFNDNWAMAGQRDLYYGRQWGNPEKWYELITPPQYDKFKEYIDLELNELRNILQEITHKWISLIEVGSGSGRIFSSLPRELQDKISYMIGIDSSSEMVEFATEIISKNRVISNKTFFIEMDGQELDTYIDDGKLKFDRFNAKPSLKGLKKELSRIEGPFNESIKVVCCMMNTLGAVEKKSRRDMINSMIRASGKNSYVLLSFLKGESFPMYSREFYSYLKEITGDFDDNTAFNDKSHEFHTRTRYVSKWFTEPDIRDLTNDLLGVVGKPKITKLGDIGYFVILKT